MTQLLITGNINTTSQQSVGLITSEGRIQMESKTIGESYEVRIKSLESMRKFIVSEKPWQTMKGSSAISNIKIWNSWETLSSKCKFMDDNEFIEKFEKLSEIIGMDTILNVGPRFSDLI